MKFTEFWRKLTASWMGLTEGALRAIYLAQEEGRASGMREVMPEHLLIGTVRYLESSASPLWSSLGVNIDGIIREALTTSDTPAVVDTEDMALSSGAKRVINFAYDEARQRNQQHVDAGHLLLGILREGSTAAQILRNNGVTLEAARVAVNQPFPKEK